MTGTTQLRHTRRSTYVDDTAGKRYSGVGVFDVPDDRVDSYLESDSWEHVEDADDDGSADDAESSSDDTDQDEDGSEDTADDFDASGFIDRHHAPIQSDLESGDFDAHLEEIQSAEESRENGPRDSVTGSIEDRM